MALKTLLARVSSTSGAHLETISIPSSLGEGLLGIVAMNSKTANAQGCKMQSAPESTNITVLLGDRSAHHTIDPLVFTHNFGLIHAEAGVAVSSADSSNSDEIARGRSVSKETVRKHLRRVFAKDGTHRQSDLIALLLTGMKVLV